MQKVCKIHGLTDYVLRTDSCYRCKKCAVDAVLRRRRKVKLMALAYKGNKCEICGYDKCIGALQFHHLDPSIKDFGISQKGSTRSWKKLKIELDKCMLLCANCHAEKHWSDA